MQNSFEKVQVFDGMKTVLKDLKGSNLKLVLLTSNTKSFVEKFFQKENMENIFDEVYFKSGIFSKHLLIKKIAKRNKINKEEILIVGDEVRDIEAAKKAKIKIISVTWGYNSKEILREYKPDFLVSKPKEILEIINK